MINRSESDSRPARHLLAEHGIVLLARRRSTSSPACSYRSSELMRVPSRSKHTANNFVGLAIIFSRKDAEKAGSNRPFRLRLCVRLFISDNFEQVGQFAEDDARGAPDAGAGMR